MFVMGREVVGTVKVASEFVFVAGNVAGIGGLGRYGGVRQVEWFRRRRSCGRWTYGGLRRVDGLLI